MKEKLRNKKVVYTIIGIVSVLLVALAVTYAYWLVTKTQANENVISSACLDISISGEKNDITLTNQFPMSDEDGMKLTPYEFTVTNNCNTSIDYQVALEATGDSTNAISSSALKVALDDAAKMYSEYAGVDATVSGAYESRKLGMGTLASAGSEGSRATHKLRVWIDADAPISETNKTFRSKISVTVGQGITKEETSKVLKNTILADAELKGYLITETPDFSKITSDGEFGLYSAEDDYGTSYYFRGDVENNYVKLGVWQETVKKYIPSSFDSVAYDTLEQCVAEANNGAPWSENECQENIYGSPNYSMYWRIVRINGDGTIRLIYDGTNAIENGITHLASIGRTVFNSKSDNAKYGGYTYADVSGNQIDSNIKEFVDSWYVNNLKSDFEKYLADSIFCNDREVTSTSGNYSYYGAYDRLETNKNPKLSCTQKEDRYTVSDTTNGNGLLSNPVGLITADEVAFAGGETNADNTSFYIYSGLISSWSMSPQEYDSYRIDVYDIGRGGYLSSSEVSFYELEVRPVINIKSDVEFTGTGTIDDPYVIVTE